MASLQSTMVATSRSSAMISRLASQDDSNSTLQQNLAKELAVVRKEVFDEYQWFKEGADRVYANKDACFEAKRMRLLYLFVRDLSSGVSGEVLSKKTERDPRSSSASRNGVELKWKVLGWLFVFFMNFGMLFYVYLFSLSQTRSRQSAWLQSFVMWLVFDMFVAGTGVVLVTHLLIPLYVMSDIRSIKKKVMSDIISFQKRMKQRREENLEKGNGHGVDVDPSETKARDGGDFNSAKYLFTSWRVASLFRGLPESSLILEFSTPWPKKSFKREKKKVTRTYERRYSFIMQAISRVLIFFVTSLIHLPVMIQDLLIHFFSNSGLGYLVLLMLRLARISPFLPLVPLLVMGMIVHFLVKSQIHQDRLRNKLLEEEESSPADKDINRCHPMQQTELTTVIPSQSVQPGTPPSVYVGDEVCMWEDSDSDSYSFPAISAVSSLDKQSGSVSGFSSLNGAEESNHHHHNSSSSQSPAGGSSGDSDFSPISRIEWMDDNEEEHEEGDGEGEDSDDMEFV
jgi:hypothetical protein